MLRAGLAPVDASGTRIGAVFFPHVTLIQEFSGPGKVSGRVPVPFPIPERQCASLEQRTPAPRRCCRRSPGRPAPCPRPT